MQEATDRKRLRKMDGAFCASLAAAIKRGEERGPHAQSPSLEHSD
jgi:hypothetical protein